jgi:glycosyltransferase involved in cell wall biosynthesis
MKITILISNLDAVGGTETQTLQIAKHLSKKHSVTVLTRRHRNTQRQEMRDGFLIKRLAYHNIPIIGFILFSLSVLIRLRSERPDVFQCMMIRPNGAIAVLAERLLGIKTFVWSRGEYKYIADGFLAKRQVDFVIRNARNLIVQSNHAKNQMLRLSRKNIHVIPNAISRNPLSNGDKILFVGRLTSIKGVEFLIDAVKSLKPRPETLIIGDGYLRKNLEEQAGGTNIRFTGEIPFDKIEGLFHQGHVLVLPSLTEGFPNVILEAMSFGIPVIATGVGGTLEIVKHGKNGLLVKPRDSDAIAESLKKILNDTRLWKRMRKNCISTVERYSWDSLIKSLERLYQD